MNARSCLWPCPPSSPHLLQPSWPRAHTAVWGSKSSGLCLSAASPQAGCQSQPWSGARQCPAGCTWGWMASCPAGSCSRLRGEHGPCWGTQSWAHRPGLPPTAPELLWHWLATHTALVSPLPTTPGPPTPQPQLLSAHHWHPARPTGDWTTQHWNESNLSFNWGYRTTSIYISVVLLKSAEARLVFDIKVCLFLCSILTVLLKRQVNSAFSSVQIKASHRHVEVKKLKRPPVLYSLIAQETKFTLCGPSSERKAYPCKWCVVCCKNSLENYLTDLLFTFNFLLHSHCNLLECSYPNIYTQLHIVVQLSTTFDLKLASNAILY